MGVGTYNYTSGAHGLDSWPNGSHQSPINIETGKLESTPSLQYKPFQIDEHGVKLKVTNSGTNVTASALEGTLILSGGPLNEEHEYEFLQFHCHWGGEDECGGEHTIDEKSFAAEVHLVHWNKTLYKSAGEALTSPNGLCVLGGLLEVDAVNGNSNLVTMLDLFHKVPCKGDPEQFSEQVFNPYCLLPDNKLRYYTYPGSLTTPPCSESVTWVVFSQPISVTNEQMNRFRALMAVEADTMKSNSFVDPFERCAGKECKQLPPCIRDNYRPVQPINDRVVKSSF